VLCQPRSAGSLVSRYKNLLRRRDPLAELVLTHALLNGERPARWAAAAAAADDDENDDDDDGGDGHGHVFDAGHRPGRGRGSSWGGTGSGLVEGERVFWKLWEGVSGAAGPQQQSSRGAMWAAGELGAALTAAFVSAEMPTGPSAAAAVAAEVLLAQDCGVVGACAGFGGGSSSLAAAATRSHPGGGDEFGGCSCCRVWLTRW